MQLKLELKQWKNTYKMKIFKRLDESFSYETFKKSITGKASNK